MLLGQPYNTWYNTVIGPVDQPWWASCNGCLAYIGRTGDALTYSGSFGKVGVGVGATAYLSPTEGAAEAEDLDEMEVGVTFEAGAVKVGVGLQDLEGSEIVVGVAVSGSSGTIGYAANITSQGGANGADDSTGVDVYLSYGNTYLDFGVIDSGDQSTGFTLGYAKSIGEATTAWSELSSFDSGAAGADAGLTARAALKYDWK
ncbi:MAG: hypothetical protein ACI9JP_002971 [Granulosicoccus sp.]